MSCIRCGGLLVRDDFADLLEVGGPMEFDGMRCLNCGFIEDAVILANRRQGGEPVPQTRLLDFFLPSS